MLNRASRGPNPITDIMKKKHPLIHVSLCIAHIPPILSLYALSVPPILSLYALPIPQSCSLCIAHTPILYLYALPIPPLSCLCIACAYSCLSMRCPYPHPCSSVHCPLVSFGALPMLTPILLVQYIGCGRYHCALSMPTPVSQCIAHAYSYLSVHCPYPLIVPLCIARAHSLISMHCPCPLLYLYALPVPTPISACIAHVPILISHYPYSLLSLSALPIPPLPRCIAHAHSYIPVHWPCPLLSHDALPMPARFSLCIAHSQHCLSVHCPYTFLQDVC